MNQFKTFTGGVLDTNCFLYEAPEGNLLFDAPQGADEAFADHKIGLLVLTHGHFDHVADAAAIVRRHQCPIAFHPDTAQMVGETGFFRQWGFALEIEPVQASFFLKEGASQQLLGEAFDLFEVPGHCPGSLCFFLPKESTLIGGDVLFRGSVGRTDLPGGDRELLFEGIRRKLFTLPDDVVVLPGHGPATTIGLERQTNPYLSE